MAVGVARVGDIVHGTCKANAPNHPRDFTGTWLTGSDTCTADNLGIVRVGDVGVTDCDHHFTAISGSDICTADGLGVHRVGDAVSVTEGGEGTTSTGSDTVQAD